MDFEINDITRNEASGPRNPCNNQHLLLIHVSYTQESDSHVQLTCSTCMVSPAVLVGYEPLQAPEDCFPNENVIKII